MKPMPRAAKLAIWFPTIFCALLSLVGLFGSGTSDNPVFYAFLPMCFYFMSAVQHAAWRRMDALEASLEQAPGAGTEVFPPFDLDYFPKT